MPFRPLQISQAPADEQEKMRLTFKGMLGEVNAGALGLIGSLMLIVTSVSLFSTIEHTLNDIWGVQRGRSPAMKIVFYWTTLTLGSVLIFVAIGLTNSLKMPAVMGFLENHGVLKILGHLLPYFVLWIGFFLFYQLMPNTRVAPRAALLGGIVAGTLWQLNHIFNVVYVSKVMSASKLYGSLGLLPIFLVGLYISWLIVVLGAQVAYTFQNAKVLAMERQEETDKPNQVSKEMVALRVMLVIARQYLRGDPPISTTEISTQIGVPLHLVNQTIESLRHARLLVEIAGDNAAFGPARPIEKITAHDVLRAMRELDGEAQETNKDEDDQLLRGIVDRVSMCAEGTARGFDFRQLAEAKGNLS